MTNYNLHSIFSYLVSDDNFLSTIIETNNKEIEQKKNKKTGFSLLNNMIMEYSQLSPYETQNYTMFPEKAKSLLTPDYMRYGIKNLMDKNLNTINISFLHSLNILLRPDIHKLNIDEQMKNLHLFETFICHMIHRNYQIDKTKRTKKIQAVNKELIKNLIEGKISHDLIQCIINIFEINLLVFDLTKTAVYFYWCKGHKYPYLNLFKNIHCMAYVQGNYEPLMPENSNMPKEQRQKMYEKIFSQMSDIKCIPKLDICTNTMIYIYSWNVEPKTLNKIVKVLMESVKPNTSKTLEDLVELEQDNGKKTK